MQLIENFISTMNRQDFEHFREFIHPNYAPTPIGMLAMQQALSMTKTDETLQVSKKGVEAYVKRIKILFEGLNNFHIDIKDKVSKGNQVWVNLNFSGTHTGKFLGIEPTFRDITYSGIVIYTIENQQIIQTSALLDWFNVLNQLGFFAPNIHDPDIINQHLETINQLRNPNRIK